MEHSLYIVGTPIGNLKDITLRALEVLKSVDIIACEDTRHSLVLLNHYQIKAKLIAFHKFNAKKVLGEIIELLKSGKSIALITDAGMPCISDPGAELVAACIEDNISYTIIGGVSAFVNAYAMTGFTDGQFMFVGFLPEKLVEKKQLVERFKNIDVPQIYYSAPHNIKKDIEFLFGVLDDREVVVLREITKLYENITFTTLKNGIDGEPKGEYVIIIKPAKKLNPLNNLDIKEHLLHYITEGLDKKQAIKQVASDRGITKSEIYKYSFDIK